jgi:hypothetical protein
MAEGSRPGSQPIEIEYDGKKYSGWYVVERGGICVSAPTYGEKFAVLHASRPEWLADVMLRELLDDAKERGDL